MSTSNRFAAFALAAILALSAVSCNGTADDPAHTTAATTAAAGGENPSPTETAAETTETTATETTVITTTAAPETEPVLPELDLASEAGLLYRLMDMTYNEIYEEFSKDRTVTGGATDFGDLSWNLQWDDDTRIQITFLRSDHFVDDPDWDWYSAVGNVTPSYVVLYGDSVSVYPGINASMSIEGVASMIPAWDSADMFSNTIVYTSLDIGEFVLSVAWEISEEERNGLNAMEELKTEEEMKEIRQDFANEFVKNMTNNSADIGNISLNRK